MKRSSLLAGAALGSVLALAGLAASAPGAHAANARNPYGNVDRRNDAGNDTGDSQTERLNSQQLNQNYQGPYYTPGGPGAPPPTMVAPPPPPMQPAYPGGRYYGR